MQELRFVGIRVIYISQGIDSASEQAETLITVHGLVDGLYLREMAAKTRRGLAGQAERGFSTGARCFGYRSVPVLDPSGRSGPDGHPLLLGKRWEIDEAEAAIIRQVFEWYAAGSGSARSWLASTRSRHADSATARSAAGWSTSVIAAGTSGITAASSAGLALERELPVSYRNPNGRLSTTPKLRIIEETLWAAVQARRAAVRAHLPPDGLMRGKNAALHSRHLFSGFMRCGLCGGTIAVVSGGYGSPRYGCLRNSKQGAASCPNRLTIRAKVADAALLAGLEAFLRTADIDALTTL